MFWVIGSDAAAAPAASDVDALSMSVAGLIAELCATSLLATPGDEGVIAALCAASLLAAVVDEDEGAVSSAPQPLSVEVATATKMVIARRACLLMSASDLVMADAVSNPFKK
ncbi:hypothetical protein PQR53_02905 [Paraburkholderia fungorum]|uniref:hypothetical protein n=1 Tax=Paraburkholderia fungorum TaxID=134537 RepID=UPI0038BB7876